MEWCGGVLWSGVEVCCGGVEWRSGVVECCGGVVWWIAVEVWCGGVVWMSEVLCICAVEWCYECVLWRSAVQYLL